MPLTRLPFLGGVKLLNQGFRWHVVYLATKASVMVAGAIAYDSFVIVLVTYTSGEA